jgi:hypothetical protein
MATFNSFANILPDPVHRITDQGDLDLSGTPGPGFSGLRFTSNGETQVSRTNSGRGVHRDSGTQFWSFSIRYNPMLREQFDPVDAFLASRNARRDPFFVALPQFARPKDPVFAAFAAANIITVQQAREAGSPNLLVGDISSSQRQSRPGDMFTINDPANANHLKVYKITAVETNARYQAGTAPPSTTQRRIHFNPPLQRNVSSGAVINFISPLFRVVAKSDLREYELDQDNLYSFSLDVEEIQP